MTVSCLNGASTEASMAVRAEENELQFASNGDYYKVGHGQISDSSQQFVSVRIRPAPLGDHLGPSEFEFPA